MGAINYGTSDIITLGIMPYDPDDLDDLTPRRSRGVYRGLLRR